MNTLRPRTIQSGMLRTLPAGFIEPCLPASSKRPPAGDGWLHEIKHDGFRCIARKDGKRVRLYGQTGQRPDQPGLSELWRRWRGSRREPASSMARQSPAVRTASPCSTSSGIADMTSECSCAPSTSSNSTVMTCGAKALESRKATLANALAGTSSGIELNEHLEHDDGALVFQHACKLGFEGIISKRRNYLIGQVAPRTGSAEKSQGSGGAAGS